MLRKTTRTKLRPGPRPVTPTSADKKLVMLAVSAGMTRREIADSMGLPERTFYRAFAHELKVGRSKRMLANVVRLDAAAEAGNVAACKALIVMMTSADKSAETTGEDKWEALAREISEGNDDNSAVNTGFEKVH
jgi:hypothetical protein